MAALPETGISISLVKQTLAAGTNDVGALCVHPNINKWSGKKPSYYEYGNFSFNISDGVHWDYFRPTGGAAHPYRLGDFRGYDHMVNNRPTIHGLDDVIDVPDRTMYLRPNYLIKTVLYNSFPDVSAYKNLYVLVTGAIEIDNIPTHLYAYGKINNMGQVSMSQMTLTGLPYYTDESVTREFHFSIWDLTPNKDESDINNYKFLFEIGNGTVDDGSVKKVLFKGIHTRPLPPVDMTIYISNADRPYIRLSNATYDYINDTQIRITIKQLRITGVPYTLGFSYVPSAPFGVFVPIETIPPGDYQVYEIVTEAPSYDRWTYFAFKE